MSFNNIEVEDMDVARVISIRKENKLNPLDLETLREIRQAVSESQGTVIISGSEKSFSAGANLKFFDGISPESAYHFSTEGHDILDFIAGFEHIVIAAINNFALGGGFELALACDFRIANGTAKIGLTEATLGIIPGWGGTQRLKELVGPSRALMLASLGKTISGEEAHRMGIIDQLSDHPLDAANELAGLYSKMPGKAVGLIKGLMRSRNSDPYEDEKESFGKVFETEDSREGVRAFLEKRKPNFKNR